MERNVADWFARGRQGDLRIKNRHGLDEQTALWCIAALCVLVERMRHKHQWKDNPTFSIKVLDFARMSRIMFGDALLSHNAVIEALLSNCTFVDKKSRNPGQLDGVANKTWMD